LFGDANVDELTSGSFAAVGIEANNARGSGSDDRGFAVSLHATKHVLSEDVAVVFATIADSITGCEVKRAAVVILLLVSLSGGIAFTFLSAYVNNHRMVYIFHFAECFYQSLNVVALSHIAVVKAHSAEEIVFGLAVGFAQEFEVVVEAAVVLGY
jgi:hypothetical protein